MKKTCAASECTRKAVCKGLCMGHYSQQKRGRPFTRLRSREIQAGCICSAPECSRPAYSRGLCASHLNHRRLGKDLSPLRDYTTHRKRGSGTVHGGYIRLGKDGRDIMEHRLIMERILGRPLLPQEVVHHVNGDRADNSPSNLELWTKSHPPGQRMKDKLAWALEFIMLYAGDLVENAEIARAIERAKEMAQ